jgi:hypothetical protein
VKRVDLKKYEEIKELLLEGISEVRTGLENVIRALNEIPGLPVNNHQPLKDIGTLISTVAVTSLLVLHAAAEEAGAFDELPLEERREMLEAALDEILQTAHF